MGIPLLEIIEELGALVTGVQGEVDRDISGVTALSNAKTGKITFAKVGGDALVEAARGVPGAVILCGELPGEKGDQLSGVTFVETTNQRLAFIRTLERFFPPASPQQGIHPTAVVEAGAVIAQTASIGPNCYVTADVEIGEGSVLHPNVSIYCQTKVGANVTIHAGVVIGATGFGYERNEHGQLESFPHIGGVIIEDEVEIGANTCIDRASLTNTLIKRGAKIDNLCHIAHNTQIGEDTAVIACSMLGGSARVGDRAWIAPGVMVLNQVLIGTDATVGVGAVVVKSVADNMVVMGMPAVEQSEFRQTQAAIKRLTHKE